MHTVFALLCFVVVIHWLIYPYPSGLLHWHCGNLTIAPMPAKQPWWIWINTSYEFIMNDCITTTKQSTTKPCAYFLGYTVLTLRLIGLLLGGIHRSIESPHKRPSIREKVPWRDPDSGIYLLCLLNTLRQRRYRQHFADDIFKHIFVNENIWISIKVTLKFAVSKGPIYNIPAWVPIMAWRRPCEKP